MKGGCITFLAPHSRHVLLIFYCSVESSVWKLWASIYEWMPVTKWSAAKCEIRFSENSKHVRSAFQEAEAPPSYQGLNGSDLTLFGCISFGWWCLADHLWESSAQRCEWAHRALRAGKRTQWRGCYLGSGTVLWSNASFSLGTVLAGSLLSALLDSSFPTHLWRVNDSDQTLPKSETEEVGEGMWKVGDVHRLLSRELDPCLWHTALAGS